MKTKNTNESSAFATSSGGAAAAPAKALSLKPITSRTRKATPKAEAAADPVALSQDAQVESTTRTTNPKPTRAKSTAVTHRHKKLETAAVPVPDLRVEISHLPLAVAHVQQVEPTVFEPSNDQVAALAYSYYVDRGYQDGNQADDWFRAVAELRAKPRS